MSRPLQWTLDARYRVDAVETIDSPALLVFPELVAQNIERALALTATANGGHCLRPHIKTVKCREVARMALARGIDCFKCSTVSEGELLGEVGAREVLLSYQLSGPKARRWAALREKYPATDYGSLVDNYASAALASEVFADRSLTVYLDINIGMDRTGIAPADAPDLLRRIKDLPGLRIAGLHVYDGHLHDHDPVIRRARADEVYARVAALRTELQALVGRDLHLVMGGSPTFAYYVGRPDTTVSPGTFYFWDAGYGAAYPELGFVPAALLLTRVLSVVDGRTICLDLGHKAVASEMPQPRVVIPTLDDYTIRGQSEEHLVVTVPDARRHRVGDVHFAVPVHVCPTVSAYERLLPVTDGRVGTPWRVVARDRMISV
ncbi:D-threonine aldolase [Neolewinella maritima]|uniref:D-threonine aldolase n=1 Tax=Neolewinella maritima TaxID=1383882 RepID=A0ABN8EZY6_9BACT|nr:D-TA family PLP-dependent enzyme [Neolewinella maritima]CAH0999559.1 D-threonine aldolase [Neolewinella maritima]